MIAAFPPERHSNHLSDVATESFNISEDQLRRAQMKDRLARDDGTVVERPETWGDRPGFSGPEGPPPEAIFPS